VDAALKRRIERFLEEEDPTELIDLIIEHEGLCWPWPVDAGAPYTRLGDDDRSTLTVGFIPEIGDDVVSVEERKDPDDLGNLRFRTFFGGGQSLRVFTALLILARAIQLDNEKRPQSGRNRMEEE
jgi:hypothetical protein